MRPLYHPSINEITLEGLLYALSDPVRLQIVAELSQGSCGKRCSNFLHLKENPLPKSTLSQHFKVLRESGLLKSERHGVELSSTLRCAELKEKFGPLLESILQAHLAQQKQLLKKKK